jgi:hypothetical protein
MSNPRYEEQMAQIAALRERQKSESAGPSRNTHVGDGTSRQSPADGSSAVLGKRPASEPLPRAAAGDVTAVPRLENVIVNVRDAAGGGRDTRECLLVFPALLTNTRTSEVMRMIEHQLKQKLRRLSIAERQASETRLTLAGAGLTVVEHVGGSFQEEVSAMYPGEDAAGIYVPEVPDAAIEHHHP